MSVLQLVVSINKALEARLEIVTPGVALTVNARGGLEELLLGILSVDAEGVNDLLEAQGTIVTAVPEAGAKNVRLFLKFPLDVGLSALVAQGCKEQALLPEYSCNSWLAVLEMLTEYPEAFQPIAGRAEALEAVTLIRRCLPHAEVILRAASGGEDEHFSSQTASAEEVGSGQISELAPDMAAALAGPEKGMQR